MVPYTVYIDPQLGHVGLHEDEARRQGRNVKVAKMPMAWVARALETDESRGLIKAVVDADSGQILGFTAFGLEGGEIMSMVEIAMMGGLPYTALRDATFAHPAPGGRTQHPLHGARLLSRRPRRPLRPEPRRPDGLAEGRLPGWTEGSVGTAAGPARWRIIAALENRQDRQTAPLRRDPSASATATSAPGTSAYADAASSRGSGMPAAAPGEA